MKSKLQKNRLEKTDGRKHSQCKKKRSLNFHVNVSTRKKEMHTCTQENFGAEENQFWPSQQASKEPILVEEADEVRKEWINKKYEIQLLVRATASLSSTSKWSRLGPIFTFWPVTPRTLLGDYQRFGRKWRIHLQGSARNTNPNTPRTSLPWLILTECILTMWAGQLSQYNVLLPDGRPSDRGSIPGRGERTFPVASVSRPALGPTQLPVQWVPGALTPGLKRGRGVTPI
jgi:hypothetical protein